MSNRLCGILPVESIAPICSRDFMRNSFTCAREPVRIGPVTAPNRFYQVPHCTGMGHRNPQTLAAMREVKAEGGWGVVCTEERVFDRPLALPWFAN